MTKEEIQLLEIVEEKLQPRERSRAGNFIEIVINLFKSISRGRLTAILTDLFPIILEKVAKVESRAKQLEDEIERLKKVIEELKKGAS